MMLLTFAFLVNRGSWTRSWLPMAARAARFWPRQLISLPVRAPPKSILTTLEQPVGPANQPLRRGWPPSSSCFLDDGSMACFFRLSIVQQTRCDPLFPDGGTVA